jgi:hypothetical protein
MNNYITTSRATLTQQQLTDKVNAMPSTLEALEMTDEQLAQREPIDYELIELEFMRMLNEPINKPA